MSDYIPKAHPNGPRPPSMYQSSHSVGDAAAVPRPVSTRSIRPARPVSGVTQQNAMLGSPINPSPSSSSTTPLSLYPSHEPPVPSSEGVYQRDTAPSIVGQGVGTALATRATSHRNFPQRECSTILILRTLMPPSLTQGLVLSPLSHPRKGPWHLNL
jgi:hypothetical protein